jgi:hypothetical protein
MALILFTCALISGVRVNRALANRDRASSQQGSTNAPEPAHPHGA